MRGFRLRGRQDTPTLLVWSIGVFASLLLLSMFIGCGGQSSQGGSGSEKAPPSASAPKSASASSSAAGGQSEQALIEKQRRLAATDPDNYVDVGTGFVLRGSPGEADAVRSVITFFDAWEQGDYERVYYMWPDIQNALSLEKFKRQMEKANNQVFDWRIEFVEPHGDQEFLFSGSMEGPYIEGGSKDWQTEFIDSEGNGVYDVGPSFMNYF
jgi:hypothetical protein